MAISLTGSATLDPLRIGIIGTGDVSIGGGSTLTCTDAIVGQGLGGAGDLAISGAGSALLLNKKSYGSKEPTLAIGQSGAVGAVDISNGGILRVVSKGQYSAARVLIGDGGTGMLAVDGEGSTLSIHQSSVGPDGKDWAELYVNMGTLALSNSGTLDINGPGSFIGVGSHDDTNGAMTVKSGADVVVASHGAGPRDASILVGGDFGGRGRLVIDGAGSTVSVSRTGIGPNSDAYAEVNAGYMGNGTIVVADGGSLAISSSSTATLGVGVFSAHGRMEISGEGSRVTLQSEGRPSSVVVGFDGTGALSITDGGRLINGRKGKLIVGGHYADGNGSILVDGNGTTSTLLKAGSSIVLAGGHASLAVQDGGRVIAGTITIGDGGIVSGNSLIDGNIVMGDGGRLAPSSETVALQIDGKLSAEGGTIVFDHLEAEQAALGVTRSVRLDGTRLDFSKLSLAELSIGQPLQLIHSDARMRIGSEGFIIKPPAPEFSSSYILASDGHDLTVTLLRDRTASIDVNLADYGADGVKIVLENGSGIARRGTDGFLQLVNVEDIYATKGADTITESGSTAHYFYGRAGDDKLSAGDGNDYLLGQQGNDTLSGGEGGDYFFGGAGADILTGGQGSDLFILETEQDSRVGLRHDTITDFSQAEGDHISISRLRYEVASTGSPFGLTGHDGHDRFEIGSENQVRITSGDGVTIVWLETDGDGKADVRIDLAGHIKLTADDFYL